MSDVTGASMDDKSDRYKQAVNFRVSYIDAAGKHKIKGGFLSYNRAETWVCDHHWYGGFRIIDPSGAWNAVKTQVVTTRYAVVWRCVR